MSKTVWVGYTDDGCEGCSEPLAVFATKFLADIWLAGADASATCRCKILELPLLDLAGISLTAEEGSGK